MHPRIKYLLSILTYLTFALGAPPPPTKQPDRRDGCHESYNLNHAFVFFHTPDDPGFDFGIKTHHKQFYPKALESALRLDFFSIGALAGRDECGWQKAKSVYSPVWAVGGRRGDIYWKYSDLHWVEVLSDTKTSHWAAASPDHKPPLIGVLPHNDSLTRISRILEDNEPAADVYQLSTICLGYTCGFLGIIVFLLLVRQSVDSESRSKSHDDTEDIELQMIKPNSIAKLPSASDTPSTVAVPRDARISTHEHNGSGQSDPPPRYSTRASRR